MQVYGHSTASVSLVGLSPADSSENRPEDAAADTEGTTASGEAVTTARGCHCARSWAQPGAGQSYKGTCAARDEEGGPWGASRSAGFCLVQPDSCEVGMGGDKHMLYSAVVVAGGQVIVVAKSSTCAAPGAVGS